MAPKRRRLDIDSVLATATRTAESETNATRQPDSTSRGSGTLAYVPIDAIAPNKRNVRRTLLGVEELAESIASVGVLEPLVARPITERERAQYERAVKYIIVMGERRHAASTLAGLTTIPVVIRTDIAHDNEIKLMMVENLQRNDLNPIDEGLGYRQLIEELQLSQRTVAKLLGVPQTRVSRRIALLELDNALQDQIAANRVGVDVATAHLVRLDKPAQAEVAARIAAHPERDWDPAEVRKLADQITQETLLRNVRSDQRDRATAVGAVIYESFDELPDGIRDRPEIHQITDAADVAAAGRRGNLLAVITSYRTGPDWYLRHPAATSLPGADRSRDRPDDAGQPAEAKDNVACARIEVTTPEPRHADDAAGRAGVEQQPEASNTARVCDHSPTPRPADRSPATGNHVQTGTQQTDKQLIATWAQQHRRIKRPELEGFARWFLERIPDDDASALVRAWLNDAKPYKAWKLQLTDDSYTESALRAAFLYAVATDYLESQTNPDSPAGRRTAARLAEQEERHRD